MSLLFEQLFACCLRSRTTAEDQPNEHTPLNANRPTVNPPDILVSDRQRIKERLGNIVRSKEGKMVNVADHLPFNFHSRNNPGPSNPRLRAESPSPHPSIGTGETTTTSGSGNSRKPLVGRFGPPKEPAFNARLVKGRNGARGGSVRGRLGKAGEERGLEYVKDHATANGTLEFGDPNCIPKVHISDLNIRPPEIEPLEDADRSHVLALSEEVGRQLQHGWNIGDAGSISRSWGD